MNHFSKIFWSRGIEQGDKCSKFVTREEFLTTALLSPFLYSKEVFPFLFSSALVRLLATWLIK